MVTRHVAGVAIVLAVLGIAAPAHAQIDSLTVTLLPSAVSFTLTSGSATNPGSVAVAATTTWSLLLPTRTNVSLYAYFSSATAALAHTTLTNSIDIPSARVEVSINGGANVVFNQTVVFGAANAGRQIYSQPITILTLSGSRTDTLALNVNLAGYGLPADTYTGALRIRARATP